MTDHKTTHPLRALISRIFCPSSSTCSDHDASKDLIEELLATEKDGSSEIDAPPPDYTARIALVTEAAAPGEPCATLEEANALIARLRKQGALSLWQSLAYSDFFAGDRVRLDELTARCKTCTSSHELVQAFVSYLKAGIPLHGALAHAHENEPGLFEACADEVVTSAPIVAASTSATQDHGDSWEHMGPAARGAAAERDAFEALADGQGDVSADTDLDGFLPGDDEDPITDAEIAETLSGLFDAVTEMRADRLAAEARAAKEAEEAEEASTAAEQSAPTDAAPAAVTAEPVVEIAPEAVEPIEQGEPRPDVTGGWSERTVYGVTVLGAPQDRAWSSWLSGKDLTRGELRRLLIEEGVEKRVATETVSRMLQHSRAKATVGKRKNDHAYHLLNKAG